MRRFITYTGPVIAWVLIIFLFSSRQRVEVSDTLFINFAFFKTLHVVEYAILYLLLMRAYLAGRFTPIQVKNAYFKSAIITTLYAASDEIHQTLVPTREGQIRDVFIDMIGIALAYILIRRYFTTIKRIFI